MANKNRRNQKGSAERLLLSIALVVCAIIVGLLFEQKSITLNDYDMGETASERIVETVSLQELLFIPAVTNINVNTATAEELQRLDGIGEAKAKAIIEYREKNGNFTCAQDLLKVSGIGNSILEKIKGKIVF